MTAQLAEKFRGCFGREPEFMARAPGRIEFIGNHTDYNGGVVLGAAIDRGVWVALARRTDGRRQFASDQGDGIVTLGREETRRRSGEESWVNYPLGIVAALPHFGLQPPGGFDYLARSNLPTGAGLSSSAAIELASALAFLSATGQKTPRETLVKIGRHAENHFVGVPCGILDQGTSGFGQRGRLVYIDCRGPTFDTAPLPAAAHFWIFNTHVKHALVDGLYAARHAECMEAAKALGVGLLADATLEALFRASGSIRPTAGKRARHVIEEIARVEATVAALRAGDLAAVGRLLTASHRSSQTLFENSTVELDFLVDALVASPKVHGARLTGGGFGGAAMALTSGDFSAGDAESIVAAYARRFGAAPDFLHATTDDGAAVISQASASREHRARSE